VRAVLRVVLKEGDPKGEQKATAKTYVHQWLWENINIFMACISVLLSHKT
jgi:hypothetical protein